MTDEQEVIERVARAICRLGCGLIICKAECRCTAGSEIVDGLHGQYAKAALSALTPGSPLTCQGVRCRVVPEEPTMAMLDRGNMEISNQCDVWEPSDGISFDAPDCAFDVYRAMLQALSPEDADDGR